MKQAAIPVPFFLAKLCHQLYDTGTGVDGHANGQDDADIVHNIALSFCNNEVEHEKSNEENVKVIVAEVLIKNYNFLESKTWTKLSWGPE